MPAADDSGGKMTGEALLQASAVAIDGHAILIEGPPGIGKSSLALALIDRGARLIGDDGVKLEQSGSGLIASPPPNIGGKLEIRHVGLVELPTASAPLGLAVELVAPSREPPPRYHDALPEREYLDFSVPGISLPGHDYALPLRAEWALRKALEQKR